MVLNQRPTKRMKRRITADFYDFLTFPPLLNSSSTGPFRTSVKQFLSDHARVNFPVSLSDHARVNFPVSLFPSLMMWQIMFRVGELDDGADLDDSIVVLDIVEEDVTCSSCSVYCDQCRVVGWSEHPVCRKRYHFIIRSANNAIEACKRECSKCGSFLQLSEERCNSCNLDITADDLEDFVFSQFEDNTHLLHGVVHSNGYGHLLTLNGREGGSSVLSGADIMGFWDRLCAAISVRKVSVMDLSKKFGLEYRLLHSVTNGHSWYGNWGYEFGTGSYALTRDAYNNAVDTLSNMSLSSFEFHGRGPPSRLQNVISLYKSLAETELVTLKDLFSFLLSLVHKFRKPWSKSTCEQNDQANLCDTLCAWSSTEVEGVQQALIKVLVASGACTLSPKWVTRQALKGAVCWRAGSPELLDYCIKHLIGKSAGKGLVVCSRCNPISSAVEFRLEHWSNGFSSNSSYPSEEQVISHLRFLFNSILNPDKMTKYKPKVMRKRVADSARKLLDCKQFMKVYEPKDQMITEPPSGIKLWCHVKLSDQPKEDPSPPPELILLPLDATVAVLLNEVTSAFQDVYAMYQKFQAEELIGFGSISDSFTVQFLLGTSGSVQIRGKCLLRHGLSQFRMERGTEVWKVDCTCGAKDDDGEKMLACDTCGVWQHTRCAGIDSSDGMPSKFECLRCVTVYCAETKRLPDSVGEVNNQCFKLNKSCRDEAVATDSAAVAFNITVDFGVR